MHGITTKERKGKERKGKERKGKGKLNEPWLAFSDVPDSVPSIVEVPEGFLGFDGFADVSSEG
jgi:hypothetical protein